MFLLLFFKKNYLCNQLNDKKWVQPASIYSVAVVYLFSKNTKNLEVHVHVHVDVHYNDIHYKF